MPVRRKRRTSAIDRAEVSVRQATSATPSVKPFTSTPCRFANANDSRRSGRVATATSSIACTTLLRLLRRRLRRWPGRCRGSRLRRWRRGLRRLLLLLLLRSLFGGLSALDLLLHARIGLGGVRARRR